MESKIPFSRPEVGEEEIAEVVDTLRNGWLTTGPKAKRFEEDFAAFVGCKHAIAVNSATSGLHLGLEAIGISSGDKVITTDMTFTASAEVMRYLGADPVFVDIDEATWNLDPGKVESAIKSNPGVKAIMPVHYGGQSCDMTALTEIANRHSLKIVEDAAHSFPASWEGRTIGTIGDVTVFSFYANKTITTGEGGMIATDDDKLAKRMRVMRLHGIDRDAFDRYQSDKPSWYYEIVAPGYKYNMPDVLASIGIHQLKRAKTLRDARQTIADIYTEGLQVEGISFPVCKVDRSAHAWHLFPVRVNRNLIDRDLLIQKLSDAGIGTSIHFIPMHLQPYWRDQYQLQKADYPVSQSVFEEMVSLPIFPGMTNDEVHRVVNALKSIVGL